MPTISVRRSLVYKRQGAENLIVEFTGNHSKVNALIQRFTEEYEVLELARTGITGLGRGIENVTYIED